MRCDAMRCETRERDTSVLAVSSVETMDKYHDIVAGGNEASFCDRGAVLWLQALGGLGDLIHD